ncbi:hypothetical protein ACFZBU_15480 [Embleya sp. NPDC008237]|uniref:YqeB family protein n=1 Tax=Embleya sp. NPDC008237 TaxID=3363978 RepID=UPI0036EF1E7C
MAEEQSAPASARATRAAERRTVLSHPRAHLVAIFGSVPALGLLLGFLLPPAARIATRMPILPMRSVVRFVASTQEPWQVAVGAVLGLLLGVGAALVAVAESTRITLTDSRVRFDHTDRTITLERADISAVFLDAKRVVVLDHDTRPLVRARPQAGRGAVAEAFRSHGYPWREHGAADHEPG